MSKDRHSFQDRMYKVDHKRMNCYGNPEEEKDLAKVLHSYAHLINEAYSHDDEWQWGYTTHDLWDRILSCIPNEELSTILK